MAKKVESNEAIGNKQSTEPDRSARAMMVRGGIGGIGKSSFLVNVADAFSIASVPLDLLQIDDQTKIERMTGQPVTTIDVAVFRRSREDGWALQRAIAPFYNVVVGMPATGRWCAIEIAGGLSAVADDAFLSIDMAEEIEELRIAVDAHIVVVASEESVRHAALEAQRHALCFPGSRLVFILNNRYGPVRSFLNDVSVDLGKPVLRLLEEHATIVVRRVQPESIRLWENLGIRPSQIARWRVEGGYEKVCAETGLDRLEARLFASEIVGWSADIREQLIAIYPVLGGSDV
ncbi:hypothetical protein [Aureimonas sp. AU20]|uniref:hypothetical protein n=1 Tax=Aureimonas sp. AU20 TaxID=1349819 RepID=UPI00071EC18A|nr:hypothetical protein [Aureimonas sp. AU20]ALN72285.1 hypothetical protein M673_06125 [Aureimonas sp. AU20]